MLAADSIAAPSVASFWPRRVSVSWLAGGVLALVVVAPSLLGGFVFLDTFASVETAVVGLLEVVAVLVWAGRGGRLPASSVPLVPAGTVLWLVAVVLSTAAATDVAPAVVRTASWVAHVAFAVVVWAEVQRDAAAVQTIERGAVVGFLAALGLGLGVWVLDWSGGATRDWAGHVPFLGNIRMASIYGLVGAFFAARPLVAERFSWRAAVPALLASSVGWAALWWGASRGALGGAVLAVGFLVWVSAGRRLRVSGLLALAIVAGAALSLLVYVDVGFAGLWRFFPAASAQGAGMDFTSGRTLLWAASIEAWRSQPWLGLGPGSTVSLLVPMGQMHAHNVVVQALVEWGLLGALPFAALAGAVLWKAVQPGRPAGAAAYLIAAAGTSMFDGLTSHPAQTAILAGAAALVLAPSSPGARLARPEWQRALRLAAAGAGVVLVVHLAVLRAVWAPGVPAPDSARARFVLAVPTYALAKEAEGWGRAWMRTDPAAAARLAEWGLALDRSPWLFLNLRGDLALQRGDADAATADYREAARRHERATWRLTRYKTDATRHAFRGAAP